MFNLERIERDNAAWREMASKRFLPGIDPADLKPGMRVTISPNLQIRDRSGTEEVHEVLAVNQTHVQLIGTEGYYSRKPRLWLIHEHHFYSADHFEPVDS